MLVALLDETAVGARDDALIGADRFVSPHDRSRASIHAELGALRQLTADNPVQQIKLTGLEVLIEKRLDVIKQALAARRRGGTEASIRTYIAQGGDSSMNRIREEITTFEEAEHRLQVLRDEAYSATDRRTVAFFLAGTVAILAIEFLVFRSIGREIARSRLTENRLRQSQERFEGIFEAATIGIALVAPDGKWLTVNPSLCEIVGYSKEDMLVTDFHTLIYPDDRDIDVAQVRQILDGEISSYQIEKRYVHKRGQVLWIALSVSLVRDEAGRPLHFVSVMEDITRRKGADASLLLAEEQFHTLADSIPQLSWMARPDGYIFWYNKRWFDYTGTTLDQMQGWGGSRCTTRPSYQEWWRRSRRHSRAARPGTAHFRFAGMMGFSAGT